MLGVKLIVTGVPPIVLEYVPEQIAVLSIAAWAKIGVSVLAGGISNIGPQDAVSIIIRTNIARTPFFFISTLTSLS